MNQFGEYFVRTPGSRRDPEISSTFGHQAHEANIMIPWRNDYIT
jgi:hypothetical protein